MKKGFTLIEMLITIVLIGALLTLTTVAIIKIRGNIINNLYDDKIEYIESGAKEWGSDNLNSLNASTCSCVTVEILITSGYITGDEDNRSNLNNPLESQTLNNKYVCVKYAGSSNEYSSEQVYNTEVTAEYMGATCSEE